MVGRIDVRHAHSEVRGVAKLVGGQVEFEAGHEDSSRKWIKRRTNRMTERARSGGAIISDAALRIAAPPHALAQTRSG
ncbi:protein of unknown function [Cupriavidus neocaledonicus]|uniref:Uncharacterized protein n=1 Tax=Cupriavidus neocaledonicus TaxID=1040979 RepID=A0A375H9Y1_9BURK|nr:protein of unknown function [Cupriavidus neocaledonicus]